MPSKKALSLVEIQESVLPEEDWVIGITDLAYFRGVGYSMPIPFDIEYFEQSQDPMLSSKVSDSHIQTKTDSSDMLQPVEEIDLTNDLLLEPSSSNAGVEIQSSDSVEKAGLHPLSIAELQIDEPFELDIGPNNLYAFIPGLFFSSSANTSADAVLVEVTQKKLLGMTLSSFRPEDVRSHKTDNGLIVDKKGKTTTVPMSLNILSVPSANLNSLMLRSGTRDFRHNSLQIMKKQLGWMEAAVASQLANAIPFDDLRKAYVSGTLLGQRFLTLLRDIEQNGIHLRYRIYIRNEKYPHGKIIETKYLSLERILELDSRSGIQCPKEMDVGSEIKRLCFPRLGGGGTEVDIEESILDLNNYLKLHIGSKTSASRIIGALSEGDQKL